MERVLIVDDDPDILHLVSYNLKQAGFEAITADTGRKALETIQRRPPDLVILDLMLPDVDGMEVCRTLRGHESSRLIPIVMLTARGEEVDRVVGFELGADDYVVKPFSPRELVLRVQAILRRDEKEGPDERIVHEPLIIDVGAHLVRLKGKEIVLTATEFKLLHRLARRPGRAFSRDQLL